MILTRVFRFYNVDFTNESAEDVTATMEGRMAKDSKKKSKSRLIDTDFHELSSMSGSPSPPAAKETRSKRKHDPRASTSQPMKKKKRTSRDGKNF